MKTFQVITLGCKLNIYESESIIFNLQSKNLIKSENSFQADIFVINTCTVTSKADAKCRNIIRKTRRTNPESLLIVCGCLVDTDLEIMLEMEEVDVFIENKHKDMIGEVIKNYNNKDRPLVYKNDSDGSFNFSTRDMSFHSRAFVKIQDGCDNSCSYCKIPMARGKGRSRNPDDILLEIDGISKNGYYETVLTGVNIGSYMQNEIDFTGLLSKLTGSFSDMRFRISSLEPQYIDDAFLDIFSVTNICPHLHVPLQSGSDKILGLMNRKYKVSDYFEVIKKIRQIKNDPFISTDLILGFPGEDESAFNETVDTIKTVDFSYIHLFGFSPRKGTRAYSMTPKIPERIRDERIDQVEEMVNESNYRYRKSFEGKKLEVVIEREKEKFYTGKSENYLDVLIESDKKLFRKNKYEALLTSVENNKNHGRVVL